MIIHLRWLLKNTIIKEPNRIKLSKNNREMTKLKMMILMKMILINVKATLKFQI